jgi:flagellar biosynthetic protein FliQ
LAGPILLASLGVGLVISIFQSVTQIQEFTLTFVPKLVAVALVILVAGHWMLNELVGYTYSLFDQIPHLLGG